MRTAELKDEILDYWVAKANGYELKHDIGDNYSWMAPGNKWIAFKHTYSPHTDWSQGGPIIHRERIGTSGPGCMGGPDPEKYWSAHIDTGSFPGISATGRTPLIAAMRAYVAGKFGEEVDDRQAHHV